MNKAKHLFIRFWSFLFFFELLISFAPSSLGFSVSAQSELQRKLRNLGSNPLSNVHVLFFNMSFIVWQGKGFF